MRNLTLLASLSAFFAGCSKPTTTTPAAQQNGDPTGGNTRAKAAEPDTIPPPRALEPGSSTESATVAGVGPGTAAGKPDDTKTADMTYKDLLELLRSKGLKANMAPAKKCQLFTINTDDPDMNNEVALFNGGYTSSQWVACIKHSTKKEAKEFADRRESGSFSWGHFSFEDRIAPSEAPNGLNHCRRVLLGH